MVSVANNIKNNNAVILLFPFVFIYPPSAIIILLAYCLYIIFKPLVRIHYQKAILFFIAVAFSVYGYGITCKIGLENDLYRYFDIIDDFKNRDLFELLKSDKHFLFTRDVLFYFVGKTDNYRLLPLIVGFNVYGICGYFLYDFTKRNNYKLSSIEYLIILVCTYGIINPTSLISNVRCVQAYLLIGLAVYRDVVQRKKDIVTILLCLVAIGLHITAIVVLSIRFISIILHKLGVFAILFVVFFTKIINIAYEYRSYFGVLVSTNIAKAYYFINWTDGYAAEVSASSLNKISRLFCICYISISIFLIFYHDRKFKNNKLLTNQFIAFLYTMMLVSLATLTIKTGAYWRFEAVVVMFSPFYLLPLLKNKCKLLRIGVWGIFIAALFMVLINILYIHIYLQPKAILETSLSLTGIQLLFDLCKGIYNF